VGIEDMQSRPENKDRSLGDTLSEIDQRRPVAPKRKSPTPFFRNRIDEYQQETALGLLRAGIAIGSILLVPSLIYAYRKNDIGFALVVCLAYALILALHFLPSLPSRVRYISIVSTVFFLGSYILAYGGSLSSGDAWQIGRAHV
jgi:hypothetical protein